MSAPADFETYVRTRQDHLLRVAVLLCGDVHTAHDLLQEGLIVLARHWRRVRDGHPDAYLRRVMYHDLIKRWRRHRLEVVTDTPPEVPGTELGERWILGHDVRQALQQVPPRQRAVLVLRYLEDLTEAQTAEVMGTSLGTVKSQHSDALATMRRLLGPAWATGTRDGGRS